MYAASKVEARIALAESEFATRLEYHSVEEIDSFNEALRRQGKLVFDDKGLVISTQSLSPADRAFIINEQSLVLCDAAYYLTRYAYLKDEENIVHRFQFRVPQRLLFDIICDLEERDSSIEIMILKARQLGVSTLVELLIGHRIIFSYGVNAIIGSADQTKTSLMANMLFLAYDNLPVWIRPEPTRRVESDRGMLVFGHQASGVSFQHGAQASGIARGTTPTIYHLSECASFTDPVNQIEASLFKAVHASPSVFGVLESTGEGDKGWWPDTWRRSKSAWPLTRLCPLFLPWFCGREMYPKPTWLRMRPVPSDWLPNHDTRLHVAKAELFVRSSPMLQRQLGRSWRMPREQQWYWEIEHEDAKSKGIESVFLQEMAGDDEEALQRSVESVFTHNVIDAISESRERNYTAYTLTGQSIEESHEVTSDYYDYTRDREIVRYASRRGETYRWEFIPLRPVKLREDDPADAEEVLFVFHPPRPNLNYSIGVDTSEGKGQDSTVVSVWSIGERGMPDVQCAEFASSHVNHVEAFAFVLAIAAFYGRFMSAGVTRWREPYVSIEQVASVGDTCQLQMAKMGYSNFHRMSRYDSAPKRIAKQKSSQHGKRGWFTYGWSRPILTTNFVHFVQNGWSQVNSPWCIAEMRDFEVHLTASGKERLEHSDESHDDRIFASAMAVFCPQDMRSIAERTKKRSLESTALPQIDLAPYSGQVITSRQMREGRVLTIDDIVNADYRLDRLR